MAGAEIDLREGLENLAAPVASFQIPGACPYRAGPAMLMWHRWHGPWAKAAMRRRELIAAFGGALILPWAARAQQPELVRHVSVFLAQGAEDDPEYEGRVAALVDGLRGLGWVEGRNLKSQSIAFSRARPKSANASGKCPPRTRSWSSPAEAPPHRF